jgi:hypothetical protein
MTKRRIDPCADGHRWAINRHTDTVCCAVCYQCLSVSDMLRALEKISEIRDSIIGKQGFNFSEHAYPLVAALGSVGFKGLGYEIASKNLGTLIEQRDAAIARAEKAERELAAADRELERWRHDVPIEGDYICQAALERDAAIAECRSVRRDLGIARDLADERLAHANQLQADIEDEYAGRRDLRSQYGAHEDETFRAFIDRITTEQNAAIARLRAERDKLVVEVKRLRDELEGKP